MLPSRAADNLFWVGRYVERAEATLRLVRALLYRMTDSDDGAVSLIGRIVDLLEAWSASSSDIPGSKASLVARAALRGDFEGSLPNLVRAAHAAASVIRDRFSPDAWRALNDLVAVIVARLPTGPSEDLMLERVERALRIISSFSGLARENMTRLAGWRFLELGRRIERAVETCRFIQQFAATPARRTPRSMSCSNCVDSQITYRQRYIMIAARAPVIDLVMLDPSNPRSVAHQFDCIVEHLAALPKHAPDGRLSRPQQIAAAAATALHTTDAAEVDEAMVLQIEEAAMSLSDSIAAVYLSYNERSGPQWEALA